MTLAVKALFFGVFGTPMDWRSGMAREAERILSPAGHRLDGFALADACRGEHQPAMEEVRSGRIPFCKLDVLHRRNLERAPTVAADLAVGSVEDLADRLDA